MNLGESWTLVAAQQWKAEQLDELLDLFHVAELESSFGNTVDLLAGPSKVTVTSALESSTLLKEASMHMDAAGRSESSLNSLVRSTTRKDFVLVGSNEGLSRPEPVPYENNTQDTLKMHKG